MMQHCRGASALAIVMTSAAVVTIAPVSHASAQEQAVNVRACAAEKNDAERLRCYDRALAGEDDAQPTASRNDDRPQDDELRDEKKAAAPVSSPAASEAQFGYRGDLAREELDRQSAQREEIERLEARVSEVASQPHGELVLTLDNGQVWQQNSPDRRIRLKVGDQVVIKRAALGSFMLVTAAGRSTRVSRVQ